MPTTMVSITIEDSGIGMDQEFIDNHIFKPFAKANVHAVSLNLTLCCISVRYHLQY